LPNQAIKSSKKIGCQQVNRLKPITSALPRIADIALHDRAVG
jgi:hypothetical protein